MTDELVNIARLALMLKVSVRWLREETDAGRIPYLQAGKDTLYVVDAVRKVLANRASQQVAPGKSTVLEGSHDA